MEQIRSNRSEWEGWAFRQIMEDNFTCHDCGRKFEPPVELYTAFVDLPEDVFGMILCADCLKSYEKIKVTYNEEQAEKILESMFSEAS